MSRNILSIIIPCYNNGNYLIQLLDCFKRQTSNFWEVVIVDDGSTDNTVSEIRKYANGDSRIKIFERNRLPKGSVVCRNIGFEKSTGDYITHIDADDLISDFFVEHRLNYIQNHPEIDYATFIAKSFIDGDPLPTLDGKGKTYGLGINTTDLLSDFLSADYCFSVWCNVYRRKSIQSIKWDEKVLIYTDFSFIIPGILTGLKHSFAGGDIDYYYRNFLPKKTSINMCSNFISEEKCESTLYLFDKTLKALSARNDFETRKNQFLNFIILHFERIMKGRNQIQIGKYINLIKSYYSCKISSKFEDIAELATSTANQRRYEVALYRKLYNTFGRKYRTNYIHSIGKWIIRK